MLHRVEGIVIRSMDYGEGNAIITLCTENAGKVGVLVRGAKKVKSRHAALIQLFTVGEFVFFRNNGGLGTLNAGEITQSHHPLREVCSKRHMLHMPASCLTVCCMMRRREAFGSASFQPA